MVFINDSLSGKDNFFDGIKDSQKSLIKNLKLKKHVLNRLDVEEINKLVNLEKFVLIRSGGPNEPDYKNFKNIKYIHQEYQRPGKRIVLEKDPEEYFKKDIYATSNLRNCTYVYKCDYTSQELENILKFISSSPFGKFEY